MPGSYLLTYSVTDDEGLTHSVPRHLYVYQAVYLSATFKLYTGITNGTVAQDIVDSVQNISTPQYAAAADWLHSNLTSDLADRMEPTDISFAAAETSQASVGSWDVSVTARLYLYQPSSVHKKDIDVFEQSLAATDSVAAAQRRMLAAETAEGVVGVTAHQQGGVSHLSPLTSFTEAPGTASSTPRQLLSSSQISPLSSSIQRLHKSVGQLLQRALANPASCLVQQEGGVGVCVKATAGSGAAHVSRRRLLQTGNNTLDALISALQDTMVNSMGASGTNTTELTTQQVDVLQVW